MAQPLSIGTKVKGWGKVASVRTFTEGGITERYYFLIDKNGDVSMMPADVIEGKGGVDERG